MNVYFNEVSWAANMGDGTLKQQNF
jgi:hypothetical protein